MGQELQGPPLARPVPVRVGPQGLARVPEQCLRARRAALRLGRRDKDLALELAEALAKLEREAQLLELLRATGLLTGGRLGLRTRLHRVMLPPKDGEILGTC